MARDVGHLTITWLSTAGPSAARRKAVDRQTDRAFRIDQMGPILQINHQRVLRCSMYPKDPLKGLFGPERAYLVPDQL